MVVRTSVDLTGVEREAWFSGCDNYRYLLKVVWDRGRKPRMFVGCNPSTADEYQDDPTIRRIIDYARRWGHGGILMTNAFAWRSTDPVDLRHCGDPVGRENTVEFLREMAGLADGNPVACWGEHPIRFGRHAELVGSGIPFDALHVNRSGAPTHPLYLLKEKRPFRWT